jgi:lipopolysaccharide transport system ATP-binding protein
MKPPPVSISCKDLTLRFPLDGIDGQSPTEGLARFAVGGRLALTATR